MQRLSRVGRENAIKTAIARLNSAGHYKMHTKGEICRKMGVKSTSRIRDILDEMAARNELVRATSALDGFNHEIAIYGLPVMRQLPLFENYGTYINGEWVTLSGKAIGYDYYGECSMCGKDMSHTHTGRCSSCEQVWNG